MGLNSKRHTGQSYHLQTMNQHLLLWHVKYSGLVLQCCQVRPNRLQPLGYCQLHAVVVDAVGEYLASGLGITKPRYDIVLDDFVREHYDVGNLEGHSMQMLTFLPHRSLWLVESVERSTKRLYSRLMTLRRVLRTCPSTTAPRCRHLWYLSTLCLLQRTKTILPACPRHKCNSQESIGANGSGGKTLGLRCYFSCRTGRIIGLINRCCLFRCRGFILFQGIVHACRCL